MIDKEKLLNDIEHSIKRFEMSNMDENFINGVLYVKKLIEMQDNINVQITFEL